MATKPLIYLKEVKTEMQRVSWPTRQEAIRLTLIVVGVSVVVAALIGGFDFLFTKMMAVIIK
ncbi:MAG TPA: preprotein translocase subunit SecE [Nevskiaceae bacterium]|nr:preprotein translocase subunit SecE [Nevskiaceae bacterium]